MCPKVRLEDLDKIRDKCNYKKIKRNKKSESDFYKKVKK